MSRLILLLLIPSMRVCLPRVTWLPIQSVTLIEIRRECRDLRVLVPGRRVRMTDEELFNHWMLTHHKRVWNVHAAFVGPPRADELIDLGLTLYANYPEIAEHGEN